MTAGAASADGSLLARLGDRATAAALHQLLDNAELLALAVSSADGLLRRSETITDNLVSGLADVRTAAAASLGGGGGAPGADGTTGGPDLRATAAEVAALLPALARAAPTLRVMLDAVATGVEEAKAPPARRGLGALVAELRGLDVRYGLRVLLGVARALGRARSGASGAARDQPHGQPRARA